MVPPSQGHDNPVGNAPPPGQPGPTNVTRLPRGPRLPWNTYKTAGQRIGQGLQARQLRPRQYLHYTELELVQEEFLKGKICPAKQSG